jgi:signal transduction histidine kinase
MPLQNGSELVYGTAITGFVALTASIAHEVNQPLSGIVINASTCLQMLDGNPPNVDGARETARRTIRDANRATDVITGLRTLFARQRATSELLDLNDAAREVISRSLSELLRSGVIVRVSLADDLPAVRGNRVQLEQVIHNLLQNALEAMREVDDRRRHVVIRTEAEQGGGVRLSVQDTGVGIEAQDLGRICDALYTTKAGGMGIGLFVCSSIVESHGGRLWAARNAGAGATVSFSIP